MPEQFSRILVPLDGSSAAEAVLPVAKEIARCCQSTVVLLHVLEERPPTSIHGEKHLARQDEAAGYLAKVAETMQAEGLKVEVHVHDDPEPNLARSIVEHVGEHTTDLTVLCAHGSSGLKGLLFGGVAQQVLQLGTGPVLLVRPQNKQSDRLIDRVVVAIDGDESHPDASPEAVAVASALSAELVLAYVVPTVDTMRGEEAAASRMLPMASRHFLEMAAEEATDRLEHLSENLQKQGLKASVELAKGRPVKGVLAIASKKPNSLLVVSTHGRIGIDAFFSGSTVPEIISKFNGPILLVKAPTPEV